MSDEREYGLFRADEIMEMEIEYIPVIEQIFNYREVICIAAQKKIGKSVLVQQLAFALTSGTPFLNTFRVSKPHKVLYIQAEGSINDTSIRLKNMSRHIPFVKENLYILNQRMIGLHTEEGLREIIKKIEEINVKFDVFILDPLYKLIHGGDTNNPKDAGMWTNNVDYLIGLYKASGIVIHHDSEKIFRDKQGKPVEGAQDNLFGSSYLGNYFSHIYKLTKHKDIHKLKCVVTRTDDTIDEIRLRMVVPSEDDTGRLFYELEPDSESFHCLKHYLMEHKRAFQSGLWTKLNISRPWYYVLKNKLLEDNLIEIEKDDNGKFVIIWKGDQ